MSGLYIADLEPISKGVKGALGSKGSLPCAKFKPMTTIDHDRQKINCFGIVELSSKETAHIVVLLHISWELSLGYLGLASHCLANVMEIRSRRVTISDLACSTLTEYGKRSPLSDVKAFLRSQTFRL